MIIFELDDVLADTSHRRHLIDPSVRMDTHLYMKNTTKEKWIYGKGFYYGDEVKEFQPDYAVYDAACVDDKPITHTNNIIKILNKTEQKINIWTNRSEIYRDLTIEWIFENTFINYSGIFRYEHDLKMRPIGDDTPQEELISKWMDYFLSTPGNMDKIDMVFSSHKATIAMWRRRGVFVFDCNQRNL